MARSSKREEITLTHSPISQPELVHAIFSFHPTPRSVDRQEFFACADPSLDLRSEETLQKNTKLVDDLEL